MPITRRFTVYTNAGVSVPPVIHVNQYDRGETWIFTLLEPNGSQYIPASGGIVGIKADGHAIINTATVNSNGEVVVSETQQMTAAPGKAVYEIIFDNSTHGTANFIVCVEPKPGDNATLSDSDLSLIQEAIDSTIPANIEASVQDWMDDNLAPAEWVIDNTLRIAGAAADAKKVGDVTSELKTEITRLTGIADNVVSYFSYTQGGYYLNTGVYVSDANWGYTDLIPCDADRTYYINTPIAQYICFYDSSKQYISGAGAVSAKSPSTASYIRVSVYNARQGSAVLTADNPYIDYVSSLQNTVETLVNKASISGENGNTKYTDFKFISGHTYKFVSNVNNKVNVASCDANNEQVESFGQINANSTLTVTASENASKFQAYFRGSGDVIVEDISLRIPVAENNINTLLPVINYEKSDKNQIDILNYVFDGYIKSSENVADLSEIIPYQIDSDGLTANANGGTLKIPVMYNSTYRFYVDYTLTGCRYALGKADGTITFYTTTAVSSVTISDRNVKYLYVYYPGATQAFYANHHVVVTIDSETVPVSYITPINGGYKLSGLITNQWKGKKVVVYGDSITAQGNGGGSYYFDEAFKHYEFDALYTRGVGGQSYQYNSATYYGNADGSYNSRDEGGNPPVGTTEHHGYFSSWDRITAMIPASIKDSIDLIILCGGHNDFASVEGVDIESDFSDVIPTWVENASLDSEWANASQYIGGDYDIQTFTGAMASTIMKFQIWCPNATIVIATPFPRWTGNNESVNSANISFRELCKMEIELAGYMQTPVIDANGKCGINNVNFVSATSDGTHPNTLGKKLYGKPFVSDLKNIELKE